jgi:very-short-patch-repair endonuclease
MSSARYARSVVEAHGWLPGTSLEDRVALCLHRFGERPGDVAQQHRVGRFRADFAWPDLRIALEADGWQHRSPEGAARDADRDRRMRAQGWLVFRVHDSDDDELAEQVARVVQVVNALRRAPRCVHGCDLR